MKFLKIVALILTIVTCFSCFAACKGDEQPGGDEAVNDGYPNHMKISIMVYSMYDPETGKASAEELSVIGDPELTIGYNDGETVIATTVLRKLAEARKATIGTTSSGSVDSIVYDGATYKADRILSERKGTEKAQSGEEFEVYYYDLVLWEWTCNGQPIEVVNDLALKDGDKLVLRLVYDNTSTENYEKVDAVDNSES